jgi:hypothetical protein
MNPNLKIVIGVQAGMLVGGIAVWAGTFSNANNTAAQHPQQTQAQIAHLLRYSNTLIKAENFNCDYVELTGIKPTVGNVVASMVSSNLGYIRNRHSFQCFENNCTFSLTDCLPWQATECSTRFLKYELDNKLRIKPESFNCFDVP